MHSIRQTPVTPTPLPGRCPHRVFSWPAIGALVLVCACVSSSHAGSVVLMGDDWALSDFAFGLNQTAATDLTASLADFFVDGPAGTFLAASNSFPLVPFGNLGVNGEELALTMESLGHSWELDPDAEFSIGNLSEYDAVYLSGVLGSRPQDLEPLRQYVNAGGGVFLAAGTEEFDSPADEAEAWAPLLGSFGLALGVDWFGGTLDDVVEVPVLEEEPLLDAVSSVVWSLGQMVTVSSPNDSYSRIAWRGDFSEAGGGPQGSHNDILAVYSKPLLAGDYNDDGRVDAADYTAWRDALGQGIVLPGDSTPETVDQSDYGVWRDSYGASLEIPAAASTLEIPEPAACGWLILCLCAAGRRPLSRMRS